MSVDSSQKKLKKTEPSRRDFLILTSSAIGAVGGAGFVWSLVDSMNPSADVLALASIDVNLSPIKEGQAITTKWRGKPIFIKHRTKEEIAEARSVNVKTLVDPEDDAKRVQKEKNLGGRPAERIKRPLDTRLHDVVRKAYKAAMKEEKVTDDECNMIDALGRFLVTFFNEDLSKLG